MRAITVIPLLVLAASWHATAPRWSLAGWPRPAAFDDDVDRWSRLPRRAVWAGNARRYGGYASRAQTWNIYPPYHGVYFRRPTNYRNLFDYPWHDSVHVPRGRPYYPGLRWGPPVGPPGEPLHEFPEVVPVPPSVELGVDRRAR